MCAGFYTGFLVFFGGGWGVGGKKVGEALPQCHA